MGQENVERTNLRLALGILGFQIFQQFQRDTFNQARGVIPLVLHPVAGITPQR
jgi:hypothetical protein